jgi:hypothetical protein
VPKAKRDKVVAKRRVHRRASAANIVYSTYASLSKVGYVPFNNTKVNQDRATELVKFGGDEKHQAFFGVFDGHGLLGHEVSEWVAHNLPEHVLAHMNKLTDVDSPQQMTQALSDAFVACNNALAKGAIDCTFSGTTVIVCVSIGNKLYSCNAGDSRAVLATKTSTGALKAVPLSDDQKPVRSANKCLRRRCFVLWLFLNARTSLTITIASLTLSPSLPLSLSLLSVAHTGARRRGEAHRCEQRSCGGMQRHGRRGHRSATRVVEVTRRARPRDDALVR